MKLPKLLYSYMDDHGSLGRKVFFLYPHSVIQEDMIQELVTQEYETYTLKDHNRAARLLKAFPGSILFINLDEALSEPEWEKYVLAIQKSADYKDCRIGIFTYNEDQDLARKYLIDYSLPAGFIRLKLGYQETKKILLEVLKANEAKGRRRFVRTLCHKDSQATINVSVEGGLVKGKLLDISSAGAACNFDEENMFPKNSYLKSVQLQLRANRVLLSALVMGTREDNKQVHVLMFDPKSVKPEEKAKIFTYLRSNLQRYMDSYPV